MPASKSKQPLKKHALAYVNQDCIGCGLCVTLAPKIFLMNAENKSEVQADLLIKKQAKGAEPNLSDFQNSLAQCPVQAIKKDYLEEKIFAKLQKSQEVPNKNFIQAAVKVQFKNAPAKKFGLIIES